MKSVAVNLCKVILYVCVIESLVVVGGATVAEHLPSPQNNGSIAQAIIIIIYNDTQAEIESELIWTETLLKMELFLLSNSWNSKKSNQILIIPKLVGS